MQTVILVAHILVCLAMIGVVLLQRSEGGALGMGGGGGGGLVSGQNAAGALVRTTMIFGGVFFLTSIVMARLANDEATQPEGAPEAVLEETIDLNGIGVDDSATPPASGADLAPSDPLAAGATGDGGASSDDPLAAGDPLAADNAAPDDADEGDGTPPQ